MGVATMLEWSLYTVLAAATVASLWESSSSHILHLFSFVDFSSSGCSRLIADVVCVDQ